jgi:hypothetical protein
MWWLLKGTLAGAAGFVIFVVFYVRARTQALHMPPGTAVSIDLRGTGPMFSVVFVAMIFAACACFWYLQQRARA